MKAESILKTGEDHRQFLFWVATLESEVVRKGTRFLRSRKGYCCLGVGQLCTVDREIVPNGFLYPTEKAPLWLREINDHVKSLGYPYLSLLNDKKRWSHKQIASLLMKLYKEGKI